LDNDVTRRRIEAIELLWSGNAYIDCASRLCQSLIDSDDADSRYDNRVVLLLVHLGLELLYKGALSGYEQSYPKNHDLRTLNSAWAKAAPHLSLELPTFVRDLIDRHEHVLPNIELEKLDLHFERFRYYADRSGRPFPDLTPVDIHDLGVELGRLKKTAMLLTIDVWRRCEYIK